MITFLAFYQNLGPAVTLLVIGTFLLAGTDAFAGRPIDDKLLSEIDRLVQRQVQPMRTTLTSANYRRLAAAGLARRLIASLR